jgi:hypothetical protein
VVKLVDGGRQFTGCLVSVDKVPALLCSRKDAT